MRNLFRNFWKKVDGCTIYLFVWLFFGGAALALLLGLLVAFILSAFGYCPAFLIRC